MLYQNHTYRNAYASFVVKLVSVELSYSLTTTKKKKNIPDALWTNPPVAGRNYEVLLVQRSKTNWSGGRKERTFLEKETNKQHTII